VKKSVYLLVLLGVGVIFLLVCLLLPDQLVQPMHQQTQKVFGPILRTAEKPIDFFGRMNSKLKTLDEAQAENDKLRQEIAELQVTNQILSDKKTENDRLREMLGFREASPYKLRACRVVSREPSSWWDTVQVNVGWQDEPNLAKDQPVVTPRGVVGKTGNVSRYVTDVILLVNENCKISSTIDGTHDQGIVRGEGNFEEGKPRVLIEYLPKDSQVAVGQFVVSSGLGPYFPAGLKLGQVVEVPPPSKAYPTFGLYREAFIDPTVDLNQLDELFVVLGPKDDTNQPPKTDTKTDAKPDAK
jgi:rod shape-determining protein MreC